MSSWNRVHEPKTGNGAGRVPLGSFSLKDIFSLSKTSLMEIVNPSACMQPSHPVGRIWNDLGLSRRIVISGPSPYFSIL